MIFQTAMIFNNPEVTSRNLCLCLSCPARPKEIFQTATIWVILRNLCLCLRCPAHPNQQSSRHQQFVANKVIWRKLCPCFRCPTLLEKHNYDHQHQLITEHSPQGWRPISISSGHGRCSDVCPTFLEPHTAAQRGRAIAWRGSQDTCAVTWQGVSHANPSWRIRPDSWKWRLARS